MKFNKFSVLSPNKKMSCHDDKSACQHKCEASACHDEKKCEAHGEEKPKIKLYYFNVRGRAEIIRWLLAYVKADWEDVRVSQEEWKKLKPTMPLGQLPVLEVTCANGEVHKLCQTMTIVRSIAGKHCLMGKDMKQKISIDLAVETLREIGDAMSLLHHLEGEHKTKTIECIKNELIPRNLGFLEKKIQAHGPEKCEITYAGICLAVMFDALVNDKYTTCDDLKAKYPGLAIVAHKVYDNPEIKAYLAKRPVSEF